MKNTRIYYLYRDASNYKVHNEAVFAGTLTDDQKQRIFASLDEGEFFLPAQVGLPEKRFDGEWQPQDDHPWFEMGEDAFLETDDPVTDGVTVTADELVAKFEALAGKWEDFIGEDGKEIMPS